MNEEDDLVFAAAMTEFHLRKDDADKLTTTTLMVDRTALKRRSSAASLTNKPADASDASRDDRRKQKKMRKRLQKNAPSFHLNAEAFAKKQRHLRIKDLQNLILWILADGTNPSWLMIKNKQNIQKVVCVMVPQLTPAMILPSYQPNAPFPDPSPPSRDAMPHCNDLMDMGMVCMGPGEKHRMQSALSTMLQSPLSSMQKALAKQSLDSRRISGVEDYALTLEEMMSHAYPGIDDDECVLLKEDEAWVFTVPADPPVDDDGFVKVTSAKKRTPLFALDCEMCVTKLGLEVTRISLVNDRLEAVYDTLVRPHNPIIDYNTKYSGITEEQLRDVKVTLADVQSHLMTLMDADTILIGHSLENDLRALKVCHGKIIDTAVIYHSSRGPPAKPALRYLAQRHLNRTIQSDDAGHDSIEDAKTCMELLQLKLKKGPSYGVVVNETESVFSRLNRHQVRSCMIDTSNNLALYASVDAAQVAVTNDDEAVAATKLQLSLDERFVFTRLHAMQNPLIATTSQRLMALDGHLKEIMDAMPGGSALIVFSGHGDTEEAGRMISRRMEYQSKCAKIGVVNVHAAGEAFTEQDLALLELAVAKARIGSAMISLKPLPE